MSSRVLTHIIIILAGLATIVALYLLSIYNETLQTKRNGTNINFVTLLQQDLKAKRQTITDSWDKLIGKKSTNQSSTR